MNKHNFRISRIASPPMIVLGLLVSLGALISPAQAGVSCQAQAGVSCHLINAKGVGQDHGGITTASVIGGGLLHGTIAGIITGTGLSGSVASFEETVTFTAQDGTLTVVLKGMIDVTTGQFNACGEVTAGTGKLSGATGNIAVSGVVNFATGVFTEDITGVVRVNLAP